MNLLFKYIFFLVLLYMGNIVMIKNTDSVTGKKEIESVCGLNKYIKVYEIRGFLFNTDDCVIKYLKSEHKKRLFVGNHVKKEFGNDHTIAKDGHRTLPFALVECKYNNVFDCSIFFTNRIKTFSLLSEKYIIIKERDNNHIKPFLFKVLNKNVHISEVVEYFVFCLRKIII